jgi:hypothetical protein
LDLAEIRLIQKECFGYLPEEAKYPAILPDVFGRFKRDPDKNFFWKNGILRKFSGWLHYNSEHCCH